MFLKRAQKQWKIWQYTLRQISHFIEGELINSNSFLVIKLISIISELFFNNVLCVILTLSGD
jgi:hypothetical protein